MKLQHWVAEFTDGRSVVHHDWTKAKSAHNAAKYFEKEYGGIVYWIEGPFKNETKATDYANEAANHVRKGSK